MCMGVLFDGEVQEVVFLVLHLQVILQIGMVVLFSGRILVL